MTRNIFGLIGWKNSGKTTLLEALLVDLTGRGYRVSSVKHAHHDADVDEPGRDSYRHRQAGAFEVMLVTEKRWALMHERRDREAMSPDDIVARLAPTDLILMEGFKSEVHRMLEVRGANPKAPPLAQDRQNIIALVSDNAADGDGLELPVFRHDQVSSIADFILREAGLDRRAGHG